MRALFLGNGTLEALARNTVDVEPQIHARYPLEHGAEVIAADGRPAVLKILIQMET